MASNQSLSTNLGLGGTPESVQDPQMFSELVKVYNAIRALAQYVDIYTGNELVDPAVFSDYSVLDTVRVGAINKVYVQFTSAASLGDIVTFTASGPDLRAAPNTAATKARGICLSPTVGAGNYGEVILLGLFPYAAGLAAGSTYYAHPVIPGAFTITPGTQPIGFALSATTLFINPLIS